MKPKFKPHTLLFLSLCFMVIAHLSHAATKYVSTTGNNANSGNSWGQAWQTLQFAADEVAAGDLFGLLMATIRDLICVPLEPLQPQSSSLLLEIMLSSISTTR